MSEMPTFRLQAASKQVADFAESRGRTAPYALATITRVKGASSMAPGDKFVVTQEGELIGFSGGGCVQRSVAEFGLKSLHQGRPLMIRSVPADRLDGYDKGEDDVDFVPSHCPSRSEVEVFMEPVLPKPRVGLFGEHDVASALRELLPAAGYQLTDGLAEAERPDFIVIATQGRGDEAALVQALASHCEHILFVASHKKHAHWRDKLAAKGISRREIDRIISPAGLGLRAKGAVQIAVLIAAQIISLTSIEAASAHAIPEAQE